MNEYGSIICLALKLGWSHMRPTIRIKFGNITGFRVSSCETLKKVLSVYFDDLTSHTKRPRSRTYPLCVYQLDKNYKIYSMYTVDDALLLLCM